MSGPEATLASLPDQISSLYPLIVVSLVLSTILLISAFAFIRTFLKKKLTTTTNETTEGHAKESEAKNHLRTSRPKSFWATVYLFIEKSRRHARLSESTLKELVKNLTRENAELRTYQANMAMRGEAERSKREELEAKIRGLEADLVKERAARQRSDERCTVLETQLNGVVNEVKKAYDSVGQPLRVFSGKSEK